ncbi:MAG: urea transporter [Bacteroidetes bacterium]|nr:urea transporter [Bacteroidota bacterium]
MKNIQPATISLLVLRGIGQIMLQNNAVSGLLILLGLFCSSYSLGFSTLIASIYGTTWAKIRHFNAEEIKNGFYGFSAALVGTSIIVFFKQTVFMWVIMLPAAIIASEIQGFFNRKKISVFTFPFVLVCWVILIAFKNYFSVATPAPTIFFSAENFYISSILKGFGQIIFQSSFFVSAIFFIAILINSPKAAAFGLAGAIVALIISTLLKVPQNDLHAGLYCYNAILSAIAFSNENIKYLYLGILSVILTALISFFFYEINVTQLTFPFVISSTLTVSIKNFIQKRIT